MSARRAFVACGALAAAAFAACTAQPPAGAPSAAPSHRPPSAPSATPLPIAVVGHRTAKNPIRLTELKGKRILYALTADALRGHYAGVDTGTSFLTNPHITFYGESNRNLAAAAPAGTVREKDKTVTMTGGVHARSQDGMTLQSDVLRYDDLSETAHASGHVVVISPRGERLDGDTAQWNLRTGDIEMNSGAS